MKKLLATSLIISAGLLTPSPSEALEKNLINNATFAFGMKCWRHSGPGTVELLPKGVCLSGGRLSHYLDLGNLEHAQPACGAPYGRMFRFQVMAQGKGFIRLGVRARIMTAGNVLEFSELWSDRLPLPEKNGSLDFKSAEPNRNAVFHDKLMIEFIGEGKAEIISTNFFYLDRKGPELSFEPAAAAVRPGDTVRVTLHTSEPNRKLECSLYPGQFQLGGYHPAKHWSAVSGTDGNAEFTFKVPLESPDGARLAVLDTESGVKANFFATIMPKKQLEEYKQIAKNIPGKQHLLFIGDSLSDYDRGRNYISLVQSFLPPGYTVRNAGVGGDTLKRILMRLHGKKTTRNNMYDGLFEPMPDLIFILCGANDAKATFKSHYKETYTPEQEQLELWDEIIVYLRKKTGAKIVLLTVPDSYLPFQEALAVPMREAEISHAIFGLPEVHDRFNMRLRTMAEKHGLEVIDFASTVRSFPDPQLLNVPDDGVHLSLKGHQLLAGLILRYLAAGEKTTVSDGVTSLRKNLSFNGAERIRLHGSSDIHCTDAGLTISVMVKPRHGNSDVKTPNPESLDIYLFKDNEFFIGRYGDRFYANFHDGTRYCGHTMSSAGDFPAPGKWSHVTTVFEPLPDKDGGYAVLLYLNGKFAKKKQFPRKKIQKKYSAIELGYGWGGAWSYQGDMKSIQIFPYALSAEKIAENFSQEQVNEL